MNAQHRKHILLAPTWIGAAVGFVTYLVIGAVPGLVYGGYMGLAMTASLFGTPVEATLAAKFITFGGMILGLAASCFFFLVAGAFTGTALGVPFAPLLKRIAAQPEPGVAQADSSVAQTATANR